MESPLILIFRQDKWESCASHPNHSHRGLLVSGGWEGGSIYPQVRISSPSAIFAMSAINFGLVFIFLNKEIAKRLTVLRRDLVLSSVSNRYLMLDCSSDKWHKLLSGTEFRGYWADSLISILNGIITHFIMHATVVVW